MKTRRCHGRSNVDNGIEVRIEYSEGNKNCSHVWKESKLLFVRVCQKCKRIEPLKDNRE